MEVPYNKNGTTGGLGESDGDMCSGAGGALVSRFNRYSLPSRVVGASMPAQFCHFITADRAARIGQE
jgi:hypothetical protein